MTVVTWWERARRLPSAFLLIAANLVPVFGVIALGWRLGDVMLLFWLESAIVGFFGILKMAILARWGALFLVPFFGVHFGGFMAVHFLFLLFLFIAPASVFEAPIALALTYAARTFPGFLALFASHAASFYLNFVKPRSWRDASHSAAAKAMGEPYTRIFAMHLAIIFGAFPALFLGQPIWALVILIGIKVIADLGVHVFKYTGRRGAPIREAAPAATS